jgi:hypothetical protein
MRQANAVSQPPSFISPVGSSDSLWRGAFQPDIWVSMPVNDTDDTD